jgi:hypothetical protein
MRVEQTYRDALSTLRGVKALQWAFLVSAVVAAGLGYSLSQQAFPDSAPSPFAQVSVSVYTKFNPSRVLLKAKIEPNASQNDRLDITVKGKGGRRDPWLLVITCPRHVPGRVPMQLMGVTPAQSVEVLASVYNAGYKSIPLGCVTAPQSGAATPVVLPGQDVNLSLPVLEQSLVGQSATAATPLYVVRGTSGSQLIRKLVQVFQAPGASCPGPGASPSPSASTPATTTSALSASSAAGAPGGTSATACYSQLAAGTVATQYSIPSTVTTSETLENVSLSGDRIDSMFPPGQITSDNRIIWQGVSGLSPSLSATSLSGAENANRDGFFAGLFYGLAAGLFVPFLQGLSESHDRVRDDRIKENEAAAEQAAPAGH